MTDSDYGKELILDLHHCSPANFTRENIAAYFKELCDTIGMERCDLHFWDDVGIPEEEKQTEPHLKGTSAIQFITTSNVTIHTLDIMERVYINLFSCKPFSSFNVEEITLDYFGGSIINRQEIRRI